MRTSKYAVFYLLFKSGLSIKDLKFWTDADILYIDTPVGKLEFEYENTSVLGRIEGESDVMLNHEYYWEEGGTFYSIDVEGEGSQVGHEEIQWGETTELVDFKAYSPKSKS